MSDGLLLLAGIVLAAIGGELFVRGAVGVAASLRIPAGIIGATIAAFATSAPEMAVGINAALAGAPSVAAGDALGSNVANIGLVLGAVLVLGVIRVERRDVRRDLPFTIAAPVVLGLLTWDGRVSRLDAGVLILIFATWLGTTILQAVRERDQTPEVLGASRGRAIWLTVAGVALLILAGRFVVAAAGGIGEALGIDPFIVGATMVAFGTSGPELATVIIARVRGMDELGIGTVMGSNIFNTLWVVGVVALIHPFDIHLSEVGVAVAAGAVAALMLVPGPSWTLGRPRGVALLALYVAYVFFVLRAGG